MKKYLNFFKENNLFNQIVDQAPMIDNQYKKLFYKNMADYIQKNWQKNSSTILNKVQKDLLIHIEQQDFLMCAQILKKYEEKKSLHLINNLEENMMKYIVSSCESLLSNGILTEVKMIFNQLEKSPLVYYNKNQTLYCYKDSCYSSQPHNSTYIFNCDDMIKIIIFAAIGISNGSQTLESLEKLDFAYFYDDLSGKVTVSELEFKEDFLSTVKELFLTYFYKNAEIKEDNLKENKRKIKL